MTISHIAQMALQLVDKASIPATLQNAQTVIAIHDMLSQIASGQLILVSANSVPPKE